MNKLEMTSHISVIAVCALTAFVLLRPVYLRPAASRNQA